MRETKHLNFNWFFSSTFKEDHILNYNQTDGFSQVDLPHNTKQIDYNYLQEPLCFGKSTYKYCFNEIINKDKVYRLVFKGVAHKADVFVNGKLVTTHAGGYDEFAVDITDYLNKDEPNWFIVIVDEDENPDIPPFGGAMDYLGYGGIYREVQLEILNKPYFQEIIIEANEQANGFLLKAFIVGHADAITIDLSYAGVSIKQFQTEVIDNQATFISPLLDLKKWDIDSPHLYDFQISLFNQGLNSDCENIRFGFRKILFTKSGFYLNDRFLKLRGLNRHQSYPYVGYAMPKSAQVADARLLKQELGVNIVRTSHYPVSEHFLNACDEIGLLVMEEIPGWQHIGEQPFLDNVLKNTKAMITRDRHHPSIILWGVRINESDDHQELYETTNKLAKQLDKTRPTGGVRNFGASQMFEDVYTFNDFTHEGTNKAIQKARKIKKNVPYLITEHNGHMFPTKPYDDEAHRVSQALRHQAVLQAVDKQKQISGCIGWCMNDYQTHPQFGSGDKICYHGVLDMFRLPKYAAFLYAAQNNHHPVLEVLSEMNVGDYSKSFLKEIYIATNCDYIKIFKDDYFVGEYHGKNASKFFKPLIKVTDFIGNILVDKYHFSKQDAKLTKQLFKKIQNSQNLPLISKFKMLYIMVKYHISRQEATGLFYKLTSGGTNWRFEGYQNNQLVTQTIKGKQTATKWLIKADADVLYHHKTYDVVRVCIKKVDQNQNVLTYAFDPFAIKTSGGVSLIGPSQVSLLGGQAAFWVRTNGQAFDGEVVVSNRQMVLTQKIKVEVE
ncbi:MAG: glycoside hydrolase family 2 protein [Bacilli bacterium]